MSSFWNFLFAAVLMLIWIIAGGFVTQASVFLTPFKNKDDDLNRAYWFAFWAAFITWSLVGIFIILIILSIIGVVALFGSGVGEAEVAVEGGAVTAEEIGAAKVAKSSKGKGAVSTGISWFTIIFLGFALILVTTTGILAAIAASSMIKSSNYDPSNHKLSTAYTDCIVSASLCLGAAGILIIGIIVYLIVGEQKKKKIQQQKELAQKQHQLNVQEVEQLRMRAIQQKAAQQAAQQQQLQQAKQQALTQKIYQQTLSS